MARALRSSRRPLTGPEIAVLATGPLLAFLFSTVLATAGSQSSFDPTSLPEQSGRVLQYSLTSRGDVDGLILEDGLEVLLPPHLGPLLVQVARPGDFVTAHGLRARAVPLMQAASVTNAASGRMVREDEAVPAGAALRWERPRDMTASGTIKARLHGPRGELNGVLLEDGTIIRFPPPDAARMADRLTPGVAVVTHGAGMAGPLGRMIETNRIDLR